MVLKGATMSKNELVEENEGLKRIIEQMKLDMEMIVGRVKAQEFNAGEIDHNIESKDFIRAEAIIAKEQRISDLERLSAE